MTTEELNKIDVCRHLLPEPGPEVVGELVEELRKAQDKTAIDHATRIVKEAIMLMAEAIDDCAAPRNRDGCWGCPRHQDGSCAERKAIDKLIPGHGNTACSLDEGGFTEFVSGLIEGWTVEGLGRAFLKSQIERDLYLANILNPTQKEQP